MITSIDHIVILADDLAAASRNFEHLGFAVEPGGRPPHAGTENALVPLADGSYIELIDVAGMARRGFPIIGPGAGSRERPDGQVVAWRMAHAPRPDLPFLIQDETPRTLRISAPTRGVGTGLRLGELQVVVASLNEAAPAFSRLLDLPPVPAHHEGPHAEEFRSAWGTLRLHEPASARWARRAYDVAGPGLGSIVLDTGAARLPASLGAALRDDEGGRIFDQNLTGGARIMLRPGSVS